MLHSMSENSRYGSNTESVVDVVTHDPPSVRSLNMKHKIYFSVDVRKEILYKRNTCYNRIYIDSLVQVCENWKMLWKH